MDISSLSSEYINQNASEANAATTAAQNAASRDYSNATDEEMMDACKQFEAYFVEQVLKEVQKTVPETAISDNPTNSLVKFFKDNMIKDLAEEVQDSSNLGLAQQMYEQMKRNYGSQISPTQIEEKETANADTVTDDAT